VAIYCIFPLVNLRDGGVITTPQKEEVTDKVPQKDGGDRKNGKYVVSNFLHKILEFSRGRVSWRLAYARLL